MKRLAIFGSKSGSNAENIYNYFLGSKEIKIVCFCTNNKEAYIVERAKKLAIPVIFTSKNGLLKFDLLSKKLKKFKVDYIILAGFLLKIPEKMLRNYPKKIINIHPSLLPKYGGRGMYGLRVHKAVLANKEKESGITIHFVNKNYDEGEVILQKNCQISSLETIESLEKKIQALEFDYFPKTIKSLILK